MNPLDLLGKGVGAARGAARLATTGPRIALHLLRRDGGDDDAKAAAEAVAPRPGTAGGQSPSGTTEANRQPGGPAPGGTGRRQRTPDATPRRATVVDGATETTKGPPEPTSAAGASGGIAGTTAAPGDAAAAGAPDPTAATATRRQRTAPQGERKPTDVSPAPSAAKPAAPEPKRSEIDRRREEAREAEAANPEGLVESEGAAAPHATIRVDAPFAGYDDLKAPEIVARAKTANTAEKAVIRLYEQTHKKRKSILDATE